MTNNGTDKTQQGDDLALVVANQFKALNARISRLREASAIAPQMYETDRDLYESLGYPVRLSFSHFESLYKRERLAKRLVKLPASESWRRPPIVSDGLAKSSYTQDERERLGGDLASSPFIEALNEVLKSRAAWSYLYRLDKLSGIGRYGIMLIGSRGPALALGQTNLAIPIAPASLSSPSDILYLKVLTEGAADINELDESTSSSRFGRPLNYTADLGLGRSQQIHYSRVLHVAEDLGSNDVYGEPRLEDAYNLLLGLIMVAGGSSEAVWRVGFSKMHFAIDPEADLIETGGTDPLTAINEQIDELVNNLRSYVVTQGGSVNPLTGEIADVSSIFDMLINLVSGDIPQHILLGSQQGKLASSEQDARNWAGFIKYRQTSHVEPMIVRPFINWLIWAGSIPEPEAGEYLVEWPSLFEPSDQQMAETRKGNAEAQAIEWQASETPIKTRWRERYGEDSLDDLDEDFDESLKYLEGVSDGDQFEI